MFTAAANPNDRDLSPRRSVRLLHAAGKPLAQGAAEVRAQLGGLFSSEAARAVFCQLFGHKDVRQTLCVVSL